MARFRFPDPEIARGFADGLEDPDGFDVVASVEGCDVEILGLDDQPMIKDIGRCARDAGGVVVSS